ncbi:MAG: hypothetical protein JOZ12_14085 [Sinobacteraceae bacterium]|nr:hypothetical protein [Nevskiaceae bacterium]
MRPGGVVSCWALGWFAVCSLGHAQTDATDAAQPMAAPAAADSSLCPEQAPAPARRRPGQAVTGPAPSAGEPQFESQAPASCDPDRLAAPDLKGVHAPNATDRWRVIDALGFPDNWRDPYATNNPLKGDRPLLDRPIWGGNYFFSGTATSNSLWELRRVPAAPGMPFLNPRQQLFASETASLDMVLYRGDTTFRPPDYQLRFTPILNYSLTRTGGEQPSSSTFGAQALFFESHLRDVSANYDFDSVRVGIQPITSDFRGFVLADQPAGVRFFGTRNSDVYQYNIGWFRRLPKNAARQDEFGHGLPANDIVLANLYVQDLGRPGLTSEFLFIYDRNRAPGPQLLTAAQANAVATFAPEGRHNYDVGYLGYSVDGHLGRLNLTGSLYEVLGREAQSMFGPTDTRVAASFAAAELSWDMDWTRARLSALYASGDSNPYDRKARGFDGISQSALFAGADASFFIHQQLPLVLEQVNLKVRDSLFPDLRSAADSGQSNYENPGLRLLGAGMDFDLAPTLRVSLDANQLWFDQLASLTAIVGRQIASRDVGTDLSVDILYRPFNSQNVIVRVAGSRLFARPAAQQLMGGHAPFSAFLNLVLTY